MGFGSDWMVGVRMERDGRTLGYIYLPQIFEKSCGKE